MQRKTLPVEKQMQTGRGKETELETVLNAQIQHEHI